MSESSGTDDAKTRKAKNVSDYQTFSSISDLTDSNKESSSNSDDSPRKKSCAMTRSKRFTRSSSADADCIEKGRLLLKAHRESMLKMRRAADSVEPTSLDEAFQLDYEEVFVKSTVPQILATTAGKIISCKCRFIHSLPFPYEALTPCCPLLNFRQRFLSPGHKRFEA